MPGIHAAASCSNHFHLELPGHPPVPVVDRRRAMMTATLLQWLSFCEAAR
jgi:hypothetical protein